MPTDSRPRNSKKYARTDLTFSDLFKDARRDYKLDLVKFEGRLIQLKKMEPSQKLRDAGIETAYEGWLVPKDEPSGNPICVVFTDPLEGVEPGRAGQQVGVVRRLFVQAVAVRVGREGQGRPEQVQVEEGAALVGPRRDRPNGPGRRVARVVADFRDCRDRRGLRS